MFARVNSAQTTADKLAGLIAFAQEQFPDAREAPGFGGFYLLADRQSGKLVSISLWDSADDLRQRSNPGAPRCVKRRVRRWASPLLRSTSMR